MEKFAREFSKLQEVVVASNSDRRKLYSRLQLLKMDIEEAVANSSLENSEGIVTETLIKDIEELSSQQRLIPLKGQKTILVRMEILTRLVGLSCTFLLLGPLGSLLLLALRFYDETVRADPFQYISEKVKRGIAWLILRQAGIHVLVLGQRDQVFRDHESVILSFSHASNLDGFLVSAVCPVRQLAFGKKELFLIPFFSWLSLAFGGVPVDRGNRGRAASSLSLAVSLATRFSRVSLAIAPEGTRSVSGQLLGFKKGIVHMWEDLRSPIVPFLIVGAFDLFPKFAGVVRVYFLDPILSSEATSRDHMLLILRRRMLQGLLDNDSQPSDYDTSAQSTLRLQSLGLNLSISLIWLVIAAAVKQILLSHYGLNLTQVFLGSVVLTIAITVLLYVYSVYMVHWIYKPVSIGKKKGA
eukprot:gene28998-38042_t